MVGQVSLPVADRGKGGESSTASSLQGGRGGDGWRDPPRHGRSEEGRGERRLLRLGGGGEEGRRAQREGGHRDRREGSTATGSGRRVMAQ